MKTKLEKTLFGFVLFFGIITVATLVIAIKRGNEHKQELQSREQEDSVKNSIQEQLMRDLKHSNDSLMSDIAYGRFQQMLDTAHNLKDVTLAVWFLKFDSFDLMQEIPYNCSCRRETKRLDLMFRFHHGKFQPKLYSQAVKFYKLEAKKAQSMKELGWLGSKMDVIATLTPVWNEAKWIDLDRADELKGRK